MPIPSVFSRREQTCKSKRVFSISQRRRKRRKIITVGCWLVPPKTIILGLRTNCVLIFVAHASSKERNFVQKNIENYNKRNACGKLKFTLSLGRDRRGARKILRCQRAKRVPEHSNDDNPSLGFQLFSFSFRTISAL